MASRQRNPGDASWREVALSLPYVALVGVLLGSLGTYVKPAENVDTVVDHLQFGLLCAGFFVVMGANCGRRDEGLGLDVVEVRLLSTPQVV